WGMADHTAEQVREIYEFVGTPPAWQGAAAQVLEPGDELPVGRAVRQQYVATRDQLHPGAFGGAQ
ncbi:hypothetical protein I3W98_12585, partial [Streptomyces cavourensis]|nr:hypothetical protein [Streptomyces cavourensis]